MHEAGTMLLDYMQLGLTFARRRGDIERGIGGVRCLFFFASW